MLSTLARVSRCFSSRSMSTAASPWGESMETLVKALQQEASIIRPKFSSASPRGWKPFESNRVVKPHEFSYKARTVGPRPPFKRPAVGISSREARYTDVFHQLNIDPLSQAMNPAILTSYMSEMGKIYGRNVTGLTVKSQKRIGKAIRRAKMMGIIPILSQPTRGPSWYPRRK